MSDKRNLAIISIIFIIFSILFYAKTGNVLIDFSRESYIPYQLNNNEKLIQDIFLIYGPFGYILNSLLYKISTNLNVLFIEAHIISYFILILFYYITKKFCKEKISLLFSTALIAISIFSNATFSFTTPYSFSTLWGYFGVYICLFALLYNKKNLLFLSLGLILSNKIELFVPIFIVSIIYLIYEKENFIKNSFLMFIFPILSYGALLVNNFDLSSISQNINYILEMTKTSSIKNLYQGIGSFFEVHYFKYNLILTLKMAIIGAISYLLFAKNKKTLSCITLILGFSFLYLEFALNLSGFILIGLTIYLLIKKRVASSEILLVLFSLILCSKSFFAINSLSYSNFGFILLLFALFITVKKLLDEKWLTNLFLIFFSLLFCTKMIFYYYEYKKLVKTPIGNFYLYKQKAELLDKTNEFIKNNIKDDESFIVVPEGQILNLIHKKPHNFYNSTFTPLDFETFGEKMIIDKLKENKTDYIISLQRDTRDYGAKIMCYDYAVDFCKYVIDNYTKVETFENKEEVAIFKIKKPK